MQKIKVGIFFGGQSREREVSFAGGRTVYDNLNKQLFEAIPIFVDSFGNFCELNWEFVYKGSIRDFYPPTHYSPDATIEKVNVDRKQCLPDLPHGFQVYAESIQEIAESKPLQFAALREIGIPLSPEQIKEKIDFAFLALHGTFGEDGSIQGLLEWYGIPYSGSGILASAMGINKAIQKDFQSTAGLYVNDFEALSKAQWLNLTLEEKQQLFFQYNVQFKEQFVIKPAHQGSSLGISILKQPNFNDFEAAINLAFFRLTLEKNQWANLNEEDKIKTIKSLTDLRSGLGLPLLANGALNYTPNELLITINNHFKASAQIELESIDSESMVLIESLIVGKEFSCIVIADQNGSPFALPPTEIRKSGELFDYRSKYLPGLSNKITPIEVSDSLVEDIRLACCQLYTHFGFEVYARIDGFIDQGGEIFLNDPNTTSGMMPSSFFFHQAAEIGLNPSDFITLIYFNSLRARIQSHPKSYEFRKLLERSKILISQNKTTATTKKKIAVIMGGYSFERHISMESGRNIFEKLSSSVEFEPIPVFLTGNREEYRLFLLPLNMMLKDNADDIKDKILSYQESKLIKHIQIESKKITSYYLSSEPLFKPEKINLHELSKRCEGVFIALHGRPGEDGTLQNDLAKYKLYHNGSLGHSAAVTINKYNTNKKLRDLGFLVANHAMVQKSEWETMGMALIAEICKTFGLPLIAKPADDGCSAAVRKIKSAEELHHFMGAIFRDSAAPSLETCSFLNINPEDELPQKTELLIEEFIDRAGAESFMEVTGGMLTHLEETGEIRYEIFEPSESLAESDILSLEEKFLAGQGQNLTPSRFSKNIAEQNRISHEVRKIFEAVARALEVTGYCRIDAFVRIFSSGKVETVIIELNSLPGMTPATCIYHQAAINGYKPFEFIKKILKFGEDTLS